MVAVKITTQTRLRPAGWLGAVLLIGGPILFAAGYWILQNGDPAGVARAFMFVGASVIGLGLVLILVGREYQHDVQSRSGE